MAIPHTDEFKGCQINKHDKAIMTVEEILRLPANSEKLRNLKTDCLRKPKIANNIHEVRNIIKLRKKLKKISKTNKCLDKSKTLSTEYDPDGTENKVIFCCSKESVISGSSEKQKHMDTSQSSIPNLNDIVKQTTDKIKVQEIENECIGINNPLQECATIMVKPEPLDVYTDSVCTNINNSSCENLMKEETDEFTNSVMKEEINDFTNSGSLVFNNSTAETNCMQCSQKIEINYTQNINETSECTKKLPIQSNIIDSPHENYETVNTVPFKMCAIKESISYDTPESTDPNLLSGDIQNTKQTMNDSNGTAPTLYKWGKQKKSLHQYKYKVKTSSTFGESKLEKTSVTKTSECTGIGNFQSEIVKSLSTSVEDTTSPFLHKPLRTYMMNVHKPTRTYERKKINRMDTDKTVSSLVANDNKLKTSGDTLQLSAANEREPKNSEDVTRPSTAYNPTCVRKIIKKGTDKTVTKPSNACNLTHVKRKIIKRGIDKTVTSSVANDNTLKISGDTFQPSAVNESESKNLEVVTKPSAAFKSGQKFSNGMCKPSPVGKSELKVANGQSAAYERKLPVLDSTTESIITNDDKGKTSDNVINSCQLNISDGKVNISDGKLKISLNTNISSDVLKSSNITCLQLPRNIVLKIVKPPTGNSNGENSEIQLISVNNMKLVLNANNVSGCNNSLPSYVNIDRMITTEHDRASDQINSLELQTGCSSQEVVLKEKVSEPTTNHSGVNIDRTITTEHDRASDKIKSLVLQRGFSGQEDVLTKKISELTSAHSGISIYKISNDNEVNDKINSVVPWLECSSQDVLIEEVSKPTSAHQKKLSNSQQNVISYVVASEPSVSSNQSSHSAMTEKSQHSKMSKNSQIYDSRINEKPSQCSTSKKDRIETDNILNSCSLLQSIRTKFGTLMSRVDKLEHTGENTEICTCKGKKTDDIRLRNKNREIFIDKEKHSKSYYKSRHRIKHKVVCNKEETCGSLISSHLYDIENRRKYKGKKPLNTHLECLKRKKHFKVQENMEKCEKHKCKNNNFVKNTDKISTRSECKLKTVSHKEQTEKRTGMHGEEQDAEIIQEEHFIDGADISVKLAIMPDGVPRIIKPKIARNILEVRKIIKLEKKLQRKIKKILKNKQCHTNTSACGKHSSKQITFADLLASPFDTSKSVVPDFLLPKVYVQPLDLNSVHGRVISVHSNCDKRFMRQKCIIETEVNKLSASGKEYYNSISCGVYQDYNDSCDNSSFVTENCVLNIDEHMFQPMIVKEIEQTEHSILNFDEHVSSPVRVEVIPQCEWWIPHSLTADQWMS